MDGSEINDPGYGETTKASLRTQVAQHAVTISMCWKWEYLTSFQEHHSTTGKNEQYIKVEDVVLVHDDIPRAKWKMAVVEQLIQGKDGYTRAANIRYSGGKTNTPIAKLYPLELSSTNSDSNKVQHTTTNAATSDLSMPKHFNTSYKELCHQGLAEDNYNWTRMLPVLW